MAEHHMLSRTSHESHAILILVPKIPTVMGDFNVFWLSLFEPIIRVENQFGKFLTHAPKNDKNNKNEKKTWVIPPTKACCNYKYIYIMFLFQRWTGSPVLSAPYVTSAGSSAPGRGKIQG